MQVRILRTKMGKTDSQDYTVEKIKEEYGITPKKLIEVKGLMGDASDNIPGVPGVGEKTALELIKKYLSIDELYKKIENNKDNIKGKLREKLIENKELAYLSKTLGTINTDVPIQKSLQEMERRKWNDELVYKLFERLGFQRFIERFNLNKKNTKILEDYEVVL